MLITRIVATLVLAYLWIASVQGLRQGRSLTPFAGGMLVSAPIAILAMWGL
jgi:hypothetical protein